MGDPGLPKRQNQIQVRVKDKMETKAYRPTPFQKFQALAQGVVSVPKAEIDKREQRWKKDRAQNKSKHSRSDD